MMQQLRYENREQIRNLLRTSVAEVTFMKVDGTNRIMKCTLNEAFIPPTNKTTPTKTPNAEVCPVWDMENQSWRSFRWNSVLHVEY